MADSLEDAIIEDEGSTQFPDSMPGMETGKLPSAEELLKLLDGMDGLTDEDRESLRADLMKSVEGGNQFGSPPPSIFTSQALILFALLTFIALIFGN